MIIFRYSFTVADFKLHLVRKSVHKNPTLHMREISGECCIFHSFLMRNATRVSSSIKFINALNNYQLSTTSVRLYPDAVLFLLRIHTYNYQLR